MPTREQSIAAATKHIALMKRTFADQTKASIESATFYQDGIGRELEIPKARYEQTEISVVARDTVSALYASQGSVALLDFASFLYPGGNYEKGAWAQEQALCSESNLYNILVGLKKNYYDVNRQAQRGGLYTDHAMYLRDVVFTHKGTIRNAHVIVVAAPNRGQALEHHRDKTECDTDLARRIECVMRVAAVGGCDTLILGAFGCGAFGNDPYAVSKLFKTWLDAHPGIFLKVTFAILRGPNFAPFQKLFGSPQPEVKTIVEHTQDDEDEDDWENIDLPEGVTIR